MTERPSSENEPADPGYRVVFELDETAWQQLQDELARPPKRLEGLAELFAKARPLKHVD